MTDPTPGKDLARVGTYGRSSLTEKQQYAMALASAGDLVPKTFWTKPQNINGQMVMAKPNPGAILYMLETAAMLGVNPMVGLTNIHIIEGKPSLSANLQAALVREAGHKMRIRVEGDGEATVAVVQIIRADDPDWTFEVRWGRAEAQAANVLGKDNWKKYYRAMLKARAITECIREACPEVLMGATYSPDELGQVTDDQGEPIDMPVVTPPADFAPQGGAPDVSRETPIVDEPPVQQEGDFDWGAAIANAASRQEMSDLFQKAKREGVLPMKITVGKAERVLGDVLVEVGKAMAAAEESEPAEEATIDGPEAHDQGEPAVLDPNVVDAEVVDEPAPKPRASRARKPSPEQEEAMAADTREAADR